MKKRYIVSLLLILLLVFAAISYRIPIKGEREMTVCTMEGEQATAYIDIKWHRYFFKPTEVRGSITINQKEYVSILDTDRNYNYRLLFEKIKENIQLKFTGQHYAHLFVIEDSMDYMMENFLQFDSKGYQFNGTSITVIEGENGMFYFGPAYTGEEALAIALDRHRK